MSRDPDDLRRFRYHTGASLRRVLPADGCPPLFRDLGLDGMALHLGPGLTRLAGPYSPITYLRTAEYVEPYTDHGQIGRLVFLEPMALRPWFSGVDHVYVAPVTRMPPADSIAVVPGGVSLAAVAAEAPALRTAAALREVLGGRIYDAQLSHTRHRVHSLQRSLADAERHAMPLRRCLQGADADLRDEARDAMQERDISEHDLCAAWHHLSDARRAHLAEVLPTLDPALLARGEGGPCPPRW